MTAGDAVVVADASAVVALLADPGAAGAWVAETIAGHGLAAPELMAFEAANVLRRIGISGSGTGPSVALAHADLLDLPVTLWPYASLAERAWELRPNLTVYDASYVALAELLEVPLVTLDVRLSRAPDLRCTVHVPGPPFSA